MRISSGIAEINLQSIQSNKIASEKTFVWPIYNAGKVERIESIARHTDSNVTYSKPSGEDRLKLISLSGSTSDYTYTQSGDQKINQVVEPGSLFDAIV